MEIRGKNGLLFCLALLWLWAFPSEASTNKDFNPEGNCFLQFQTWVKFREKNLMNFDFFSVQALMGIKAALKDPHSVLTWDDNAVDACTWNFITCSPDKLVIGM